MAYIKSVSWIIVLLVFLLLIMLILELSGGDTENVYLATSFGDETELTSGQVEIIKNMDDIWAEITGDGEEFPDFDGNPLELDYILPFLTMEKLRYLSSLDEDEYGEVQSDEWNADNKVFLERTLPELISDPMTRYEFIEIDPEEASICLYYNDTGECSQMDTIYTCPLGGNLTEENKCIEKVEIIYYDIDYGKYLDYIWKHYYVDQQDIKELWVRALEIAEMAAFNPVYVRLMGEDGLEQAVLPLERYIFCTLPAEFPVGHGNVDYAKAAAIAIRSYVLAVGRNPQKGSYAGIPTIIIEVTNSSANQNTSCGSADNVGSSTREKIDEAIVDTAGEVLYYGSPSTGDVVMMEYSRCGAYENKVVGYPGTYKVRSYCDADSYIAVQVLSGYSNSAAKSDCIDKRPDFASACGHTRGMSQVGALYVALIMNYDYRSIINHYYYGHLGDISFWVMENSN